MFFIAYETDHNQNQTKSDKMEFIKKLKEGMMKPIAILKPVKMRLLAPALLKDLLLGIALILLLSIHLTIFQSPSFVYLLAALGVVALISIDAILILIKCEQTDVEVYKTKIIVQGKKPVSVERYSMSFTRSHWDKIYNTVTIQSENQKIMGIENKPSLLFHLQKAGGKD